MTGRIVQGTFLGIALAVILNWIVYFISSTRGVGFLVQQPISPDPQPVTLFSILIVSIISIAAGGLALWILDRVTANPLAVFLWLTAVVGLISIIFLYQSALGLGSFASLGLMHIVTATAAALGLTIFFQRCETCS